MIRANIANRNRDLYRLPDAPIRTTEKNMKLARASQLARCGRLGSWSAAAAPAAVVVTLMAEEVVESVPGAVIVVWLNRQRAPVGSPEQERAMVPVNPEEEETLTEVEADCPGAETVTWD